jgi:hypothetical protein
MPKFDTSTPTLERTFSGVDFKVPAPFAAEHVLTAPEAAWLNSNLASVVGNAFSGDIRRGLKTLNDNAKKNLKGAELKAYVDVTDPAKLGWDMQAEFNAKFGDYVLGESNRGTGGGNASDPLSQLIRMFSTVDIKARLAAKDRKVAPLYKAPSNIGADGNTYTSLEAMKEAGVEPKYPSKWEELVSENIKVKGDQFRAQAEAQMAQLAQSDTSGSDDLLDGLGDEAQAEAPAAQAAE